MECYYHPEREGTDTCAICGKSVCKECSLEIAGKIYCKDCLEKIVGVGLTTAASQSSEPAQAAPMKSEPARLNKQTADDSIYQPRSMDYEPITPETYEERPPVESKTISADSPYNINSGGLESSYEDPKRQQQVAQNEFKQPQREVPQQRPKQDDGYIYPDHSYEPQPRETLNLEDKYEKYLDDLYFDENEIPLNEQLAKDEEEYGSLTRKPYTPRKETPMKSEKPTAKIRSEDVDRELEAKIRDNIGKENDKPIHNLNYQQEKEPLGVVDIILTIILIIVILVVIYYLIFIFVLSSSYPTFMDAVYALGNPQNVINNILK